MTRYFSKLAVLAQALLLAACATHGAPQYRTSGFDQRVRDYRGEGPSVVRPESPLSCVPYARERSGIAIYGDAYTWWDQAQDRYASASLPSDGSVMVLTSYAGEKQAHLAVVTRTMSSREIRIDHANWLNDGNIYLDAPVIDVSPANDWSQVRVWNTRDGHFGARTYAVRGFIAPVRLAAAGPSS